MYFLSAVASGCTFCCFSILVIRTFLFLILLRKRWKSCQLQPAACPLIQGSTGKERKKKRRRRKKRGKRAPFSGSVVKPDKLLFRNFGIVISVRHKVLGHCYKKQPQLTWLGHVIHSKEHKSSSSGRHLHGRTFLLSHFESLLYISGTKVCSTHFLLYLRRNIATLVLQFFVSRSVMQPFHCMLLSTCF